MLYDGPSGNDINTLVTLYFIFHHCEASFLFCFCWRQVTSCSALAPHILLGKLCLWPSENQAKDVSVCQRFFLPPHWCCLGQEINLFVKWQEGRLLSSCLYWTSTARWALCVSRDKRCENTSSHKSSCCDPEWLQVADSQQLTPSVLETCICLEWPLLQYF